MAKTLRDKHLEAILDNVRIYDDVITGKVRAAAACTQITIDFAKEFAEWISNEMVSRNKNGWALYPYTEGYLTTDQLIEQFLTKEA